MITSGNDLLSRFRYPNRRAMALLIAAPFIVAACSGATADDPAGDVDTAAATAAPAAGTGSADAETAAEEATWRDIELTDAATGETFTVASLEGQVVALEPMAIWCTNCKVQQDQVKQAYDDVVKTGVRYISLGVDPNESDQSLANYQERREYPWTFSQAPRSFARALSDEFGPQILSPPSTPLIVIDAEGEVASQTFGFHGPDKLLELLQEAAS